MSPSKFAKRNDKDSKREAKRVIEGSTVRSHHGEYVPPSAENCAPCAPTEIAPSDSTRLFLYMLFEGAQLVKFTMLHFIKLREGDDGWYNLVRIDCSHGHVHKHFDDEGLRQKSPRHIRRLDTVVDVAESYDEAYAELFDVWAENERRFSDARRKSNRRRPTGRLPQTDPPADCVQEDERSGDES